MTNTTRPTPANLRDAQRVSIRTSPTKAKTLRCQMSLLAIVSMCRKLA